MAEREAMAAAERQMVMEIITQQREEARQMRAASMRGGRANGMMGPGAAPVAGPEAVEASKTLRRMKESDSLSDVPADNLRRIGERTFVRIGGGWFDVAFEDQMPKLELKFGSDAYFAAIDALPELTECLALGESVVVVIGKKALIVAPDRGTEQMDAAAVKAFFAAE
jgi:hypothetical protein